MSLINCIGERVIIFGPSDFEEHSPSQACIVSPSSFLISISIGAHFILQSNLDTLISQWECHPTTLPRLIIYFNTPNWHKVWLWVDRSRLRSNLHLLFFFVLIDDLQFCSTGIWYPKGGFHALPRSLESIAKKHGARVIYSSPVKRIVTSEGPEQRAVGVELATGEILAADVVISNADLVWTYQNLLPETDFSRQLARKSKLTCSSLSFYWALRRKLPSLVTHQVFLAKDYQSSFDTIFDRHLMPDQPSFYVNVPSRIDPSAAPADKDAMIILVPLGHLDESNQDLDWDQIISRAREFVLNTLEQNILQVEDLKPGERFSDLIEFELLNTPHTWQQDLNLFKGSILGLSHNIFQVVNFRPGIRHGSLNGMYFVGASTQFVFPFFNLPPPPFFSFITHTCFPFFFAFLAQVQVFQSSLAVQNWPRKRS